jgi:glucose/mannose-6-phosphate isomerase
VSSRLDAIRAVDSAGQLDQVLGLPAQIRDALWRVESARLSSIEADGLIVCGMGGSAIGGDLAAAAIGERLTAPFTTVRGYELPSTAGTAAVLCSSYSGNTEETLACYADAGERGSKRIAATTGGKLADRAREDDVPVIGLPAGFQPRAAVAYMLVCAAEVAALAGAAPSIRAELESAASWLEGAREGAVARAGELAEELSETIPVIYGAGPSVATAYRWKCQLNENAKLPAFSNALPEMDHNEIVGWDPAATEGRLSAVFLEDPDQHPRERKRIELTAKLVEPAARAVHRVEPEGPDRISRLLWTVMLGDLIAMDLAARRGIDPSPVEVIERLKKELG